VVFVEAGVHNEGDAAAQRTHTAEQECSPHVSGISGLLVNDGRHCHFAAGAVDIDGIAEVLRPK
jgi:hypothetical protein